MIKSRLSARQDDLVQQHQAPLRLRWGRSSPTVNAPGMRCEGVCGVNLPQSGALAVCRGLLPRPASDGAASFAHDAEIARRHGLTL